MRVIENRVTKKIEAMAKSCVDFSVFTMKIFEDVAKKERWLKVQDLTLEIDADALVTAEACPAATNLRSLTVNDGELILEAGKKA